MKSNNRNNELFEAKDNLIFTATSAFKSKMVVLSIISVVIIALIVCAIISVATANNAIATIVFIVCVILIIYCIVTIIKLEYSAWRSAIDSVYRLLDEIEIED